MNKLVEIELQVIGISKLIKNFNRLHNEMLKERTKKILQIALFMENEIKLSIAGQKSEAPSVDTGRFLSSIKGRANIDTAIITDGVNYGQFLEFGTSRTMPRKHFSNSLKRNKLKILEKFRKII